MSIHLSDRAKNELVKCGVGGAAFLRISVVSGGCSGNTYSAAIDDTQGENDTLVYQDGDFRVVADRRSAAYLAGLEIDYSDDLVQSGFRFKNPLAAKSCGCGASFAALSFPESGSPP
jgi:iron-sulfur cluster assembly protein